MNKQRLFLPSHIIVKDGLACGDKLSVLYDTESDRVLFQIIPDACSYCKCACDYLQQQYNNKPIKDVASSLRRLLDREAIQRGFIASILSIKYEQGRMDCYLAPFNILDEIISGLNTTEQNCNEHVNLYTDKLDCDACAVRENVSWLYQKPKHIHGQYAISDSFRETLMKLGKVSFLEFTDIQLAEIYSKLSDDDFEFLEDYKLLPMVYNAFKVRGVLKSSDTRWRLLIYQLQRTVTCSSEFDIIMQYIKNNHLSVFPIKGAYTGKYYKGISARNLTDFDLLASREYDAFIVMDFLLKRGFRIFPDSFSLKKVTGNGEQFHSGHVHLQKIINLQYRMIVDINFPSFPMLRVGGYRPSLLSGEIRIESIIVITLCHLFKHKEVFMKDINDLYLMLTSNEADFVILSREIIDNGLAELFSFTLEYFKKEYPASAAINQLIEVFPSNSQELGKWPYSSMDTERIKRYIADTLMSTVVENERLYLYPVMIFDRTRDTAETLNKLVALCHCSNCLTEDIIQIQIGNVFLILTPIGIFLEMKEYYTESQKGYIRGIFQKIDEFLDYECVDIPYALDFDADWLDAGGED